MVTTVINLSSLDGSSGFRMDGIRGTPSMTGSSVSDSGDVNGDGFDDVIIGAPYDSFAGSSNIVFGKAFGFGATFDLSSLNGNNGFRMYGLGGYLGGFGGSVSSAGDINGDGFDDVIVGAPRAYEAGLYSGASFVVFGKASGFDATLLRLDGRDGFKISGLAEFDNLGKSVSDAGDVNGDGFDDLIIGAPYATSSNGDGSGSSYIVFGRTSGFSATLDLSSLDGSNGFRMDGIAADDRLGRSVSSAGDVNGDGFDDVIVGALDADLNGENSGASYVVFGKASGFGATLDLSNINGNNGFRIDGAAGDRSGQSVSGVGDVNDDGFEDLVIGVYTSDSNGAKSGSSYVVFGKANAFDAVLNLSSIDGSNGFRLDGAEAGDWSGWSVSGAGDVNGDGFDDVIIGAPFADPNSASDSGSSYVVFGKAAGFDTTLDLSNLDSNSGFRLDGVAVGDAAGWSVSGAGDVNGDGFDDVIVGAPKADVAGSEYDTSDAGVSYMIFGKSNFGSNVIQGTSGDDLLKGTSAAETFEAGDGNDRMTGRGGADEFHGGAGDDYIQVADLGFGSVDGGSGNDVLHTDGKGLNLGLGLLGDKIHGVETICLYGRGDNALTLTAEGLLNLSDTTNTLRVNGNAGDHVTVVDDGWVDEGPRGSGYYHVYTNDDAVLLVGMNVTVDFA